MQTIWSALKALIADKLLYISNLINCISLGILPNSAFVYLKKRALDLLDSLPAFLLTAFLLTAFLLTAFLKLPALYPLESPHEEDHRPV